MSDWIPSAEMPGYMERKVQRGPAVIITRRPILSKEEAAKREKQTRQALESALYVHKKG